VIGILGALFLASSDTTCLKHLEKERGVTATSQDRADDLVGPASVSCSLGLTASEFDVDLAAIRSAARGKDCASVLRVVYLPLTVIDDKGRASKLGRTGVCRNAKRIRQYIALASTQLDRRQVELYGWRGVFVGGGSLVLNTDTPALGRSRLKIVTISPVK
jgi:hypothetical protein